MKRALLLLLLAGCMEAQAGPSHGPGVGARMLPRLAASGAAAPSSGTATYGRTWNLAFDGRSCTNGAFSTWSDQTALGVDMALDATDTDYTCDYSTAGLAEAGIGTALVDQGVRLGATGGAACWADATPSGFPGMGDNEDWVIRMIFRANVAPAVATQFMEWNPGGSEFIEMNYLAADTLRLDVDEAAGTEYLSSATGAVTAGAWHFTDWYYDAIGTTNPVITICLDGTCTVSTEHTGLHGPFSSSGAFALGGDNTCLANIPDTTILFWGLAIGANAAFWAEATHDSDCQATGICP